MLNQTASTVRLVDHRHGDRYRITDVEHAKAGRSGTLEFVKGKPYLLIDGWYHSVSLEKCVRVHLRAVK